MTEVTERTADAPSLRFRPYPEYRDSGVEWLGKVPIHWDVRRLKLLLQEPLQYGANEPAELTDPNLPRYIRITDVSEDGRLREDTFRSIPEDVASPYLLKHGDLLFARSGATVGKTFRFEPGWGRAAHAGYLIRARLKSQRCSSRFVQYFTTSRGYRDWLRRNFIQATIQNVNADRYANLEIPLPKLGEQHAIADFLDRETAKIDGLVARKERLIELLQEKRTALITRAVTRGLDPDVPMKDSGVEWLGDIPAHWETLALGRVTISRCDGPFGSGLKSEHYSESGIRVVRLQNIGWAEFINLDAAYLDEAYARRLGDHSVKGEDILIGGLGDDGHPVGRACVAPVEIEPAMVTADCFRFRLDRQRVLPRYAAFQLSATASAVAGCHATGATRTRMNLTTSASRKIALPPLREQGAIAIFLDRETAKIDALAAKVRKAIDHLKEFRTALVSAAVTGKIDVRATSAEASAGHGGTR